jgi:hypothetical protein
MLSLEQVDRLVEEVARKILPASAILRVQSLPMANWVGDPAFNVLLVLSDEGARKVTGQHALSLLHAVQEALRSAGEDRFAHLTYATESELAADADSEL